MAEPEVIQGKYTIIDQIGQGSFGTVYKGKYNKTNEFVAIKTEDSRTSFKMLKRETSILKYLHERGCRQIPIVFWYGIYKEDTCLVMSYYECSLHSYFTPNIEVDIRKVNKVMAGCIQILETIHNQHVIHRDIKPQNFMLRAGSLFLIDFGLATFYLGENGEHSADPGSHECITGTPRYVSYNVHRGHSPSRRDDMISLGYMYIYLYCGELPWDESSMIFSKNDGNTDVMNRFHYKNVFRGERKEWNALAPISVKINDQITQFLNYCYQLTYEGIPDYKTLIQIFDPK